MSKPSSPRPKSEPPENSWLHWIQESVRRLRDNMKLLLLAALQLVALSTAGFVTCSADVPGVETPWNFVLGLVVFSCIGEGLHRTWKALNGETLERVKRVYDGPVSSDDVYFTRSEFVTTLIVLPGLGTVVGLLLSFGFRSSSPDVTFLLALLVLMVVLMILCWRGAIQSARQLEDQPVIEVATGGFGGGIRGIHVRSPLVYGMLFTACFCSTIWLARAGLEAASKPGDKTGDRDQDKNSDESDSGPATGSGESGSQPTEGPAPGSSSGGTSDSSPPAEGSPSEPDKNKPDEPGTKAVDSGPFEGGTTSPEPGDE